MATEDKGSTLTAAVVSGLEGAALLASSLYFPSLIESESEASNGAKAASSSVVAPVQAKAKERKPLETKPSVRSSSSPSSLPSKPPSPQAKKLPTIPEAKVKASFKKVKTTNPVMEVYSFPAITHVMLFYESSSSKVLRRDAVKLLATAKKETPGRSLAITVHHRKPSFNVALLDYDAPVIASTVWNKKAEATVLEKTIKITKYINPNYFEGR